MKKMLMFCLLAFIGAFGLMAQEKTVQISLPKYCCSESDPIIEKTLAYEKGVESFQLNPVTKSVLVTFKETKTSQEKIEKALAKAGFETPSFPANKRAVEKLPACCKNTAKGLESGCSHNHGHVHSEGCGHHHHGEEHHDHSKCGHDHGEHHHDHSKCSGDHSKCNHNHDKKDAK